MPVDSVIYGRDDDKEIILNWLTSNAENDNQLLSIISIVGMGVMGKTTLTQHYTMAQKWRVNLMSKLGFVFHKILMFSR